jgi:hypothetical protein
MAITRFNKFTPRDYNMEWFVPKEVMPNIEAWDSLLTSQQQKFDTSKMLLSEKNPKYLQTEEDRQLFQKYKEEVSGNLDNITNAYQNKGVSAGNQALQEAVRTFSRHWQPGGIANVLEDRYNAFANAQKEIETGYKDDPRGINKQYAMYNLKKQLESPIKYNAETGEYQRISTPELYKDPNIQKLILDAINQVKESGDTDIVRLSPTLLEKIKTEGRSANVLQNIGQAIYQQYPNQLNIESWYRKQNTNPELAKKQYEEKLDSIYEKQSSYLDAKLSKEEVKSLQSDLVEQGYDIKIDGDFGAKTKEAYKEYLKKTKQSIEEQKQNFNVDTYIQSQVTKGFDQFARSFANKKVDKSLIFDQAAIAQMKIRAARKNTESLIGAMQEIANPETNLAGATPDRGINMEEWNKQKEVATTNLSQAENLYNKTMTGKAGEILGTNANNVSLMIDAYSKSGGDPNAFYNVLKGTPEFATMSGKVDFKKAFDFIQNNHDNIAGATDTYIQARQQKDLLDDVEKSVSKTYIKNEGQAAFESLKSRYKKPTESDEDFLNALLNKDSRFISGQNTGLDTSHNENIAESFIKTRNEVINKSSNPEYAKSTRSFEISAPENDKSLGTFAKSILQDIDNGDYYGYVSDDQQGFVWKDLKGNKKDGIVTNKQVSITSFGESGKPQIKVTGTVKDGKGKETYVNTYLEIPKIRYDQVRQTVLAAKAQAKRTNDSNLDYVSDLTLGALNGDQNYTKNAAQDALKLHLNNTSDVSISMPVYDQQGNIKDTHQTTMKGKLLDTEEINGYTYKKYKVLDDTGNTKYRVTMVTPKGEVVVPNRNGGIDFNNSSSVDVLLNGKKYDLQIPVKTTFNKVPSGKILTSSQIGQLALGALETTEIPDDEPQTE